MGYNSTDILFASLVGSSVDIPRFNAVQNELSKKVLPPIPFLPRKQIWKADPKTPEEQQFFPLKFIDDNGQPFLLPYEPMINITGENTIVRRNVAKAGKMEGTIKERWARGDYEITITGVLIGELLMGTVDECYPIKDFQKLKEVLTAGKRWKVECEPLQLLGINYLVIESFSFPFTKGENVQAYEIKAYSDFEHKLLLDIED